ncbi:MAG: c-type cytochrome biogenesis protein CcmI [Betaproteobacteria bacterium]|nr:c-type cytochrome biogenesis protein CcmI [Betaproteobacteria bacterium]
MIGFWIVAAAFVAAALLFLLPPLLARGPKRAKVERRAMTVSIYQDELAELDADLKGGTITSEQYEHSRNELQRRMLEDVSADADVAPTAEPKAGGRWAAWIAGLGLPVFAVALYLVIGNPETLSVSSETPAGPGAGHTAGEITPQQILAMVDSLAARLEKNPNDAEGWIMLARSYTALGRYGDATVGYARAAELVPNDAQLLADYADVQAMAAGRSLKGKPAELVNRALQVDPSNRKALALAGTAAFETRNYPAAVEYWERLLKLVPEGSPAYQSVAGSIAEARAMAGESAGPAASAAKPAAKPGKGVVSGTVSLSPSLAGKMDPDATLFVFARAASGPKMPLAIQRLAARDLPATFSLDDSMAMVPEMRLSNFPDVVVGARISRSGNAAPQSGDLQATVQPVKVGAAGVKIVISEVVP